MTTSEYYGCFKKRKTSRLNSITKVFMTYKVSNLARQDEKQGCYNQQEWLQCKFKRLPSIVLTYKFPKE